MHFLFAHKNHQKQKLQFFCILHKLTFCQLKNLQNQASNVLFLCLFPEWLILLSNTTILMISKDSLVSIPSLFSQSIHLKDTHYFLYSNLNFLQIFPRFFIKIYRCFGVLDFFTWDTSGWLSRTYNITFNTTRYILVKP